MYYLNRNIIILFGIIFLLPLVNALDTYCDNVFCYSNLNGNPLKYYNGLDWNDNLTNNGAIYNQSIGSYAGNGLNQFLDITTQEIGTINDSITICANVIAYSINCSGQDDVIVATKYLQLKCREGAFGTRFDNSGALGRAIPASNTSANTWYHICGSQTVGTNLSQIWLNGIYFGNTTQNRSYGIQYNTSLLSLGASQYFNGSIDNLMIFNTSLSASQVLQLYQNVSPLTVAPDNIVLWTGFDNNSIVTGSITPIAWCTISDYLSALGTGTLYGYKGNNLTNTGAVYNQTEENYMFDGINDFIGISNTTGTSVSINGYQNISLVITFKTDTQHLNSSGIFTLRSATYRGLGFNFGNSPNKIEIYSRNDTLARAMNCGINDTDGQWHQYVGTYDGRQLLMHLYRDGVYCGNTTASRFSQTNDLNIGRNTPLGGISMWFNGSIDDVMIFNRSLSASEILALYQGQHIDETGLVDKYTFTNGTPSTLAGGSIHSKTDKYFHYGCTGAFCYMNDVDVLLNLPFKNGTQTRDYSIYGNNITTGTAIENETDNSMTYNGANEYLEVPVSILNMTRITVTGWFYIYNSTSESYINWRSGNEQLGLRGSDSRVLIYLTTNSSTVSYVPVTGGIIGRWVMLGMTYDGATTTIYVDGQNVSSTAQTGLISYTAWDSSYNAWMNRARGGTSPYYYGANDDIRIFNRSLSSQEIAYMYAQGRN